MTITIVIPSTISHPIFLFLQESVKNLVETACNKGMGRNNLFKRLCKFIGSIKVPYFNCSNNQSDPEDDDIDSIMAYFENSDKIRITTLSDVPKEELTDDPIYSYNGKNNNLAGVISIMVSTTKNKQGIIINSPVWKMSSTKSIKPLSKVEHREKHFVTNWHFIHFYSMNYTSITATVHVVSWSYLGRWDITSKKQRLWTPYIFM